MKSNDHVESRDDRENPLAALERRVEEECRIFFGFSSCIFSVSIESYHLQNLLIASSRFELHVDISTTIVSMGVAVLQASAYGYVFVNLKKRHVGVATELRC